jgi:hypothetical protein
MVMDIVVAANNKLRLGTHGKGLWEADMPQPGTVPFMITSTQKVKPDINTASATSSGIYPNPTTGRFSIVLNNVSKAGTARVRVYTLSGVLVHQFSTTVVPGKNTLQSNLGTINKGTYEVIIETGGTRTVQRLIKQ